MLLKAFAGPLALVALVAAPPAAGLTYSLHMEARQSATPSSDPIAAMLGPAIMQSFPAGGIDQSVSVGEKGVRAEQKQSFGGIPAGAGANGSALTPSSHGK